jgi:hypothetical protein
MIFIERHVAFRLLLLELKLPGALFLQPALERIGDCARVSGHRCRMIAPSVALGELELRRMLNALYPIRCPLVDGLLGRSWRTPSFCSEFSTQCSALRNDAVPIQHPHQIAYGDVPDALPPLTRAPATGVRALWHRQTHSLLVHTPLGAVGRHGGRR